MKKFSNILDHRKEVTKTLIASLNQTRRTVTVTLVNNKWLYLVGGYDGDTCTEAVHYLDLETKQITDGPRLK